MSAFVLSDFPGQNHRHESCIRSAAQTAEAVCRARGVRLTPLRRQVLEWVWSGHQPVRAYDLLDRLRQERSGAAPATVYRALDFLLAEGLIHRLESLNAFVGCGDPEHPHSGQFLICRHCHSVAELGDPEVASVLTRRAIRTGFEVERQTIELYGLCPACRD